MPSSTNLASRAWLYAFRRACGLTHAVSPKATGALELNLGAMLSITRTIKYGRPRIIRMRLPRAEFSLFIPAGQGSAQNMFTQLSATNRAYEPIMTEAVFRLLRHIERPSFLDVGAFVGYYACYVASILKDQYRTCAVESNPAYAAAIEEAIRINGLSNVSVYNVVLGDKHETLTVTGKEVLPGGGTGLQVQGIPLDQLCEEQGLTPNIVKIDVHGAEGKVLKGMRRLLTDSLQFLLLELHPISYLNRYSEGILPTEILRLLQESGFTSFHVSGHRVERTSMYGSTKQTIDFRYRPLDGATEDLLLFDRDSDIFVLATKDPDIRRLLAWDGEPADSESNSSGRRNTMSTPG